jgi:hypothetical protein
MSKKPARSNREADLPDWAEDVTPSDEVMKKFYAPTGSFKPGPIVVPKPESTETGESGHQAETSQEEPAKILTAPEAERDGGQETSPEALRPTELIDNRKEEAASTSLPQATAETQDQTDEKSAQPISVVARETKPIVAQISSLPSQTSSFEDFARKWRRYLYPGQLAVMRTLFELTFARNTNECFTRYSELAAATKMTRRNCINVMNSLVERGFVERLEVRNDASGKGIRLRVHPDPVL